MRLGTDEGNMMGDLHISRFKDKIKENTKLMQYYYRLSINFRKILYRLSPVVLVQYLFITRVGRIANLNNPQTFDEKLLWLMLFWSDPLKIQCADKYAVRSYVTAHGLGDILPELLGCYERTGDIDYTTLPERFVLKCTHGSRMNIICKDKSRLDIKDAHQKLEKWLKMDISEVGGESHYRLITPRIICEEYLENLADGTTDDYKLYCFNGKVHCTMVCTQRWSGAVQFDFYDREWQNKLPYDKASLLANRTIQQPEAYAQMLEAAEILSKPFPFVRVDFYCINGKAVFGEMTFTPNGCIDTAFTEKAQMELGELLVLPL